MDRLTWGWTCPPSGVGCLWVYCYSAPMCPGLPSGWCCLEVSQGHSSATTTCASSPFWGQQCLTVHWLICKGEELSLCFIAYLCMSSGKCCRQLPPISSHSSAGSATMQSGMKLKQFMDRSRCCNRVRFLNWGQRSHQDSDSGLVPSLFATLCSCQEKNVWFCLKTHYGGAVSWIQLGYIKTFLDIYLQISFMFL